MLRKPPKANRVVVLLSDEDILTVAEREEEIVTGAVFTDKSVEGAIAALFKEIGREATVNFVRSLLEKGISEFMKHYPLLMKKYCFEMSESSCEYFTTPDYQYRFDYLCSVYEELIASKIVLEIAATGMEFICPPIPGKLM